MDIHHIDTGRGNCTLIVAPDGTTVMIDAGASNSSEETSSKARPDASRRPGEWIARYALRHAATDRLDYLIVTHLHPDHMGDINDATPLSGVGPFRLTGVSDVDRLMPITTLIDRAYPDYQRTPHHPRPSPKTISPISNTGLTPTEPCNAPSSGPKIRFDYETPKSFPPSKPASSRQTEKSGRAKKTKRKPICPI